MLKFDEFFNLIERLAPLKLSELSIVDGGYDNSGVIVKCGDQVKEVLFTLDLSNASVEKAIELGCDTIVTHHPAIYYPIKSLSIDNETKPLISAIKNGISIISMHLNLDIASQGIDESLAIALGDKVDKILELVDGEHGYGRECKVDMDFSQLVDKVKKALDTDKVIAYGSGKCQKIASFCGGGGSHALKAIKGKTTDADVIISSDLAHHEIKEIIESGKKLVIIPHYASEQLGFSRFESLVKELVKDSVKTHYFQDKRFM